jgi:hypothetical protein
MYLSFQGARVSNRFSQESGDLAVHCTVLLFCTVQGQRSVATIAVTTLVFGSLCARKLSMLSIKHQAVFYRWKLKATFLHYSYYYWEMLKLRFPCAPSRSEIPYLKTFFWGTPFTYWCDAQICSQRTFFKHRQIMYIDFYRDFVSVPVFSIKWKGTMPFSLFYFRKSLKMRLQLNCFCHMMLKYALK